MLPAPASPLQIHFEMDIAADADKVFAAIVSEPGMRKWAPGCREAKWLHAPGTSATGVGSVRRLLLPGGTVARERIVAWQGHEFHYVIDGPLPPLTTLTADYVGVTRVETLGPGRSRLVWNAHYRTPGWRVLPAPLLRAGARRMFATMGRSIAVMAETG